ncbi:hypothetical protein BHE74_00029366 [Ensete ventricosum]|nr:hypothetical protein BHE74_00029366 [Ensete ventricosum]RZS08734.1 hypothetical protein BHM03_00039751 [Ensete ventricosum]
MEENGHASTYQREARSANWKAVLFVTPGELPHSSTGLRQCANGCVANFCCGFSAEGVSARMGRRGGGGKTGEWGSRRWAVGAGASRWLLLIPVHLTH